MASKQTQLNDDDTSIVAPVSLPKGGGAIRGMGDKFDTNLATGTGSIVIPIPSSESRGEQPQLSLSYSSASGNGPFGLGWSLSQPQITRKTDKGLPQYRDDDVFIFFGEDLVPRYRDDTHKLDEPRGDFLVRQYSPRIEGSFNRIERWTGVSNQEVYWKTFTPANVMSIYGSDKHSRIQDANGNIFSWLLSETYDTVGNAVVYEYKPEDTAGVSDPQSRSDPVNLYLKTIKYGSRKPKRDTNTWLVLPPSPDDSWMFSIVFDYGEHGNIPKTTEDGPWPCRHDPFSNFRSCFEIRTYRLCQRILMFHHFPEELAKDEYLVFSTDLTYDHNPYATYLTSATHVGYIFKDNHYVKKSLPPLELSYSLFPTDDELSKLRVQQIDDESLKNLPQRTDGTYQWLDLDGEGLAGVFGEQQDAWFYKRNISSDVAGFGPLEILTTKPSTSLRDGQFMDLTGDGHVDLVKGLQGYHERTPDGWSQFHEFHSIPNVNLKDPNVRFVDLTGDGLADIMVTEDAITWYHSLGKDGYEFGSSQRSENRPRVVSSDPEQSIYLADMSGDGLSDLVRVRNGNVVYWPNMGYANFGSKIVMNNSPFFDYAERFDQRYLHVADIDGSGTADILYIRSTGVDLYLNQSGNGFSDAKPLSVFVSDNYSKITTVDLFGTGTACLVWSSPFDKAIKYVDITPKPHLLVKIVNNLGAETQIKYASSTKFYLQDKFIGKPWITKLAFPVHCVETITILDHIQQTRFTIRYAYHHGYFDGVEREFRGFAMVEKWDTETVETDHFVPPVYTKTWFHTGAFINRESISRQLAHEYYGNTVQLDDTILPHLTTVELREACRALKGRLLRQEIFAQDGSEMLPYTVEEHNYSIDVIQRGEYVQFRSVFNVHPRESINYNFERTQKDPRIKHDLVLQVDPYGNPLKAMTIAYGKPSGLQGQETLATYHEWQYTNHINDHDNYLLPQSAQSLEYQIYGVSNIVRLQDLIDNNLSFFGNLTEIPFEAQGVRGQKRLIARSRTLYRSNDLSKILVLQTIESLGIHGETYELTFTPGLLKLFKRGDEVLLSDPTILGRKGGSDGGYVDLDGDGCWWSPSGRNYFHPMITVELSEARAHFFKIRCRTDPFGQSTILDNDVHDLFVIHNTDAEGNTFESRYDYRTLQLDQITDPNGNRSQCMFDELGMVIATALMGKTTENVGDSIEGLSPLSDTEINQFFADPHGQAPRILGYATTRIVYDLNRYHEYGNPGFSAAIVRETHVSDGPSKTRIAFSYIDGFGHEVQGKVQTEPGVSGQRWTGTGWTIFNNKALPVKQFEPFFDATHEFHPDHTVGVSKTLIYDPLGRVIATVNPNHTWSKTVHSPWKQEIWDVNDTTSLHPKDDPDIRGFFKIPEADYIPTWFDARIDGAKGPEEQSAAIKANMHSKTPSVIRLDSLGRTIITIEDNKTERYTTHISLDIQGRTRELIDANNRVVERFVYDMRGVPIHKTSMEAGERWQISDTLGRRILSWDSRQQHFRTVHDTLRRPTELFLTENLVEVMIERQVYGQDAEHNQRGRVFQTFDQTGKVVNTEYDFKGNHLQYQRQLAVEHKENLNWSNNVSLGIFYTTTKRYDALNREIECTTPDDTVARYDYNQTGLLQSVQASLGGGAQKVFISNIDYNAKGQRTLIQFGNSVATTYEYDPDTFQLATIKTRRDSELLQNLSLFYDPIGNLTRLRDDAQQTIFFRNKCVDPTADYTYDPIYRLINASGREYIGQIASDALLTEHPGNGNDMATYLESYTYDPVGNMLSLKHEGGDQPRWTKEFGYHEQSQLEHDKFNNRLSESTIGGTVQKYAYDGLPGIHGNMTSLPQLSNIQWNFKDELQASTLQVNGAPETTYYVYDSRGIRVRKVTESGTTVKERIYFGEFEIYRMTVDGTVALERQTVHITDYERTIALVETRTQGVDAAPVELVRYQHSHTHSVNLELDDQAQIISYEEYGPYGLSTYQATRSQIEPRKRYRFTCKERDQENGLSYHERRYYSPSLGRWINCDPIGTRNGPNIYAYVDSNPINRTDPQGTQWSNFLRWIAKKVFEAVWETQVKPPLEKKAEEVFRSDNDRSQQPRITPPPPINQGTLYRPPTVIIPPDYATRRPSAPFPIVINPPAGLSELVSKQHEMLRQVPSAVQGRLSISMSNVLPSTIPNHSSLFLAGARTPTFNIPIEDLERLSMDQNSLLGSGPIARVRRSLQARQSISQQGGIITPITIIRERLESRNSSSKS